MMQRYCGSSLLRYAAHLSRNYRKECSYDGLQEILYRTSCTVIGTHPVYSKHQPWNLIVRAPMMHSSIKSQNYATTVVEEVSEPGFIKRFVKKMGWLDHSKSKLKRSGYLLYENIGEKVSAVEFFEVCELPDTFFSWFLVTELHVWMMMVRLMAEGDEGKYTRNCLIEAMWEDVGTRAKKLGDASPNARNEQIQEIVASFQAALFAYDEGILSDDKALASALWRRLFSKSCSDPERLECIVQYVRKQMAYLDTLSKRQCMLDCKVEFLPVLEEENRR